ncbi:apolipoprotein N-acyltransferase [Cellulomonas sp. 179-A 4D5 NHS]|uniref:apolipoprotein N-acyltransferase n=1 Tax=Cellulomonas sp. 179-A 4D5 NHS TaxID=3142378 RepID=UPI00399F67B9
MILAALGGWLTNLAFPDRNWWPLAFAGVALLLTALRKTSPGRAAGTGLAWGLCFFLPHVEWAVDATGSALPWIALSMFQASYIAGFAVLWAYAQRAAWICDQALVRAATAAVLWVAVEQLRGSWPFGGFPWGYLAFSQTDAPGLRLAPYGGEILVSAVVVLVAAALAASWQLALTRSTGPGALAAAGALALTIGPGLLPVQAEQETGRLRIGAVQGDVPTVGAPWVKQARQVTANHARGTERVLASAGAEKLDVILWPESAADIDPRIDAAQASLVDAAAAAAGAPVLLGTQRFPDGEDVRFNEMIVWQAGEGAGPAYAKQHPVPFGEFVPYRNFFRQLTPLVDRIATDMVAGAAPAVATIPIERLARSVPVVTGICFEVAYADIIREGVREGGELIVIPTNNASFGRSQESTQQLAMSRFRAAEHARATIQISTVGVSAVITPDGEVVERTELFTADELVATLPLRTTLTPATRLGAIPELGVYVLAAAAVVAGVLRGARHPDV